MTRIMVVDDEQGTNTLAAEYLRLAGFEVLTAYDGASAISKLAAGERVDLVVADQRLPDMDGWELCAKLKSDPSTRSLPVMVLTATGAGRHEPKERPDAWMAKPFRPKDFVAEIKRLLGQAPG
ncbi:MAG: response regulator [Elusimicrobia bacterium]|nr:response regulator [Elusimicrobiota bacterium]